VAPIVEGHGEVESVRTLLTRIWRELLHGEHLEVMQPIRQPRSKLMKEPEIHRAVKLALLKLEHRCSADDPGMVLVLVDADKDLPCVWGPQLLERARAGRKDADISCVIANIEYETWFVAAAESLGKYLDLSPTERLPDSPEEQRLGKGWIVQHYRGTKYSETIDQPSMTAKMDLSRCRQRSPSFDKLCRELHRRR
jgi:hypothetical protein